MLRVCLDARFPTAWVGGVEQVVMGLAAGLSNVGARDETFHFLTLEGQANWLQPFLRDRCRPLLSSEPPLRESGMGRVKRWLPGIASAIARVPMLPGMRRPTSPLSDGTIEAAGIDVMHFTAQRAFLTEIPSIYLPHDLQHVHLPEFFTARERDFRERSYLLHSERAAAVVVMTEWGKEDIVNYYGLPVEKVRVIPWAPVLEMYPAAAPATVASFKQRFDLPGEFAFYPAASWPHKNHLALIEALAVLRHNHRIRIPLICSGLVTSHHSVLQKRIAELNMEDQVRFLGFVKPDEMRALYQLSKCLLFPSLFEGWGMPICEAFSADVPVACSDATTLPEVAGDAAVFFNPRDPENIADVVERLWVGEALQAELIQRGRERVRHLSWERTAAAYVALYREVAGRVFRQERTDLQGTACRADRG